MPLLRRLAGALLAVIALALASPAQAALDFSGPPSPTALATMWMQARADLRGAAADAAALREQAPAEDILLETRRQLAIADADYRIRVAARTEQVVVYAVAVDGGVADGVRQRLDSGDIAPLNAAVAGLQALWKLAGIDDLSLIRVRYNRDFNRSAPVAQLLDYYRAAGNRYGIDWTFLAAINYVESDFGRVNGPSSAGALGPMQFMPSTWQAYGNGGDVMNPRDAIEGAARYLQAMGGPGDMDRAIYRYNNDRDYVRSINSFAAAFRADPTWLETMYYWSTAG